MIIIVVLYIDFLVLYLLGNHREDHSEEDSLRIKLNPI